MSGRGPRALAAVLTLVLVASAIAGPVAAAATDGSMPGNDRTAAEVYVADNGDAILVYSEQSEDESTDGEFGLSVEDNLVYGQITDSVEGMPETRWNVSGVAEPTHIGAQGNLTAPRPPSLESFDLSITGRSTADDSRADVDVSATIAGQGMSRLLQSAATEGDVTMGPDQLSMTGSFEVQSPMASGQTQHESLTLSETDNGYVLTVERNTVLSEWSAPGWQNRSAARETIKEQYGALDSGQNGPTADVTIDSYELSETATGQRLQTSFTVEYQNVEETVRQLLVAGLSEAEGTSTEQAETLADEMLAATINEVSYDYSVEGGTTSGSLTVDVSDYDGLVMAYFEYAQSLQNQATVPGGAEQQAMLGNLDRLKSQFEAQQAAGLEQQYTWDGTLESSSESLNLDFSLDYRTTNWGAYVEELKSRDVPFSTSEFAFNGTTEEDRLTFQGEMDMNGDELFADLGRQLGGGMATEAAESDWGRSLVNSRPERARFVGSYDANGLNVQGGASFGNLSALSDDIAAEIGTDDVSEIVVRSEGNVTRSYVRVSGALSGDTSESAARSLPTVEESTTVHTPGSWSDDDVPSMDVDRASAFVQPGQSTGFLGPGFGAVAALLAILAVAVLIGRRR